MREANGSGSVPDTLAGEIADSGRDAAQALNAFLMSVERRALRIAEIMTRDRDEALDLVQDAMMSLARHYRRRPAAEWPPLFYRILDNRIRDWQRRQTVKNRLFFWRDKTPEEEHEDPLVRMPDPAPSAEGRLAQREAMSRLESALRALPRRQREAFVLRIWEGFDVARTAQAMGCSGGSVKTHLSRALAALRKQLEEIWP
jgi:RNA polymerase sigma-70 factor (ECF subfamily)